MKFALAPESKPLAGYTIKRAIHRGGFGEVYYALSDAGKEVALKLLHNNLDVELRGVSQCLNLKHPNLVTIFDMRQDADKDHWIIMEYVGGKGLHEVLQENPGGLPLKEVFRWLQGMTAGLSFLHDRGLVHRDLKPANVFSDADQVKIGDVGLSKYISESRRSAQTQSVGTVYYMAPEVARGRYGREVDVYSLGVILYEMITGRVPFEGETTAEILMKHLTAEPDLSVLPEKLRPILAAALEKDPDRRISDVEELERRFRKAVEQSAFSMEQPSPVYASSPTPEISAARNPALPRGRDRSIGTEATSLSDRLNAGTEFWNKRVPTPIKWILCGAVLWAILRSGAFQPLTAGGILGGLAYLLYRTFFKSAATEGLTNKNTADAELTSPSAQSREAPSPATQVPTAAAPIFVNARDRRPAAQAPRSTVSLKSYTPATARQIPAGQRASDITASLSVSLAAAALVTIAVHLATDMLPNAVDVAFFGIVTLIAAWVLIVPAKLWEGRTGDNVIRRLIQGGLGLGVGALAFVLQQFLLLNESPLMQTDGVGVFNEGTLGRLRLLQNGQPTMAGFMVFFGALFLMRRWWWQADSFRKTRFRISSSLVTLFLGVVLSAMLPFSEQLGAIWALAISAVVQLSSGWTPVEDRLLSPAPGAAHADPIVAEVHHPVVGVPAAAGHRT
ncbi:MAG: protein kinase [Planctomycetaceae bacterium]|nr:protein kinase [Planctomycetaceae bacterium]